jgi:hypothetical protein
MNNSSLVPIKKKPGTRTPLTDEMVAEALTTAHGLTNVAAEIISNTICMSTGKLFTITGRGVRKRISKSPFLQGVIEDERSKFLDLCESRLFQAVESNNLTAIIFGLKTIGKGRGYIESARRDMTTPDGTPLTPPSVMIRFISGGYTGASDIGGN